MSRARAFRGSMVAQPVFAYVNTTTALAFVCVGAEGRAAGLADLISRNSFGCKLPITVS